LADPGLILEPDFDWLAFDAVGDLEIMLATNNPNRNATDILLLKMVKDGLISKVARGKYVTSGKIGKKDLVAEQSVERTAEKGASANLSDLSSPRKDGGPEDS
jgi:hypothetical protein